MIVMAERIKTRSDVMRQAPRACNRLSNHVGLEILPVSAFSWGDGSTGRGTRRRRLATCDDCRAREAEEKAERERERMAHRSTWVDPETFLQMRRCSKCHEVKELDVDFYVEKRDADGFIAKRTYICNTCATERTTALHRQRLLDAATADQERANRLAWRRSWRARNRERYRETQRRYKARVKADPVRNARRLEAARIAYRLRAERAGRPFKTHQRPQHPPPERRFPRLPAAPLLNAVEKHVKLHGLTEVNADLGVDERAVRRWRKGVDAGKSPTTTFNDAERALIALGLNLWDVWPEDEYPNIYKRLAALED